MAAKTTKKTTSQKSAPTKKSTTSKTPVAARVTKSQTKRETPKRTAPARTKKETSRKESLHAEKTHAAPLAARMPQMSQLKVRKSTIFIGLGVVVLIVLLYLLRGLFVVATVNGQPISRLSIIHDLEQQYGKQQVNTAISKTLIMQEANRRHISVTQTDIDNDVKNVEKQLASQGQKLDQVLQLQGMTRAQWLQDEKFRIILQKMFQNDVKVSNSDIDNYIKQNQSSLPDDAATNKQVRDSIAQRLQSQKLSDKIQSWLADQQKKAKIVNIVNY